MNLYLYGYGPEGAREWLIVDMGVTFGGEHEPGIDIILPDIRFLEEERREHRRASSRPMRMRIISAPSSTFGRGLAASPSMPRPSPPPC